MKFFSQTNQKNQNRAIEKFSDGPVKYFNRRLLTDIGGVVFDKLLQKPKLGSILAKKKFIKCTLKNTNQCSKNDRKNEWICSKTIRSLYNYIPNETFNRLRGVSEFTLFLLF